MSASSEAFSRRHGDEYNHSQPVGCEPSSRERSGTLRESKTLLDARGEHIGKHLSDFHRPTRSLSVPPASQTSLTHTTGSLATAVPSRSKSCHHLDSGCIDKTLEIGSLFRSTKKPDEHASVELTAKSTKPSFWRKLSGSRDQSGTVVYDDFYSRGTYEHPIVGPRRIAELPSLDSSTSLAEVQPPADLQRPRWFETLDSQSAMDPTRLRPASFLFVEQEKNKRVKDASDMFQTILRNAEKSGTAVPPYEFMELIGKGAFGRVYKCKEKVSGRLVAIKITNIDDQDYDTHWADHDASINDFRKEVSILQQLKENKARNVNVIHDAFDLHSQLWIVAEYCTGGSVRTLLRPSQGRGLDDQFIIPIARELAIALKDIHEINIIHRDIKCSNVYITENGEIQLGDFGVVGSIDDGASKRKTVLGTPQYMPYEMMQAMVTGQEVKEAYGTEVDIWAYGATLYEMATGRPPFADLTVNAIAQTLETGPARLQEGEHSQDLVELVALCMVYDPKARPTAGDLLNHPFIADSSRTHPTSSLVKLIERFKVWEHGGGSRQSLWVQGGAAAPPVNREQDIAGAADEDDGWTFSTSETFDQEFGRRYSQYLEGQPIVPTESLPQLDTQYLTPAERVKREHIEKSATRGEKSLGRLWGGAAPYELHNLAADGPNTTDLPLRTYTDQAPMRTSMLEIDLDAALARQSMLPALNLNLNDSDLTIKPSTSHMSIDEDEDRYSYYQREREEKRDTMAWKFPSETQAPQPKRNTMAWTFATAESFEPESSDSVDTSADTQLAPGFRPTLKHSMTEPVGSNFGGPLLHNHADGQLSSSPPRESAAPHIDLSLDDPSSRPEIERPSTASSNTGSMMTDVTSGNPFDLEEDPVQNEMDRNRFSYHKQWQSEGGRLKRRSHKTQMHARGSSLSSTDSEVDRAASERITREFVTKSHLIPHLPRWQMEDDLSQWPGSQAFIDTTPPRGVPSHNGIGLHTDGYPTAFENLRTPGSGTSDQPEVLLPELESLDLNAMTDGAHPLALAEESYRQLGIQGASFLALADALLRHYPGEDTAAEPHSPSDLDSGLDSTRETNDEEGTTNGNPNRRKPRKIDTRGRSPNLPQSGFQ